MESRSDFLSRLTSAGHVIPSHVRGVVGRSRGFEEVVAGLSRAIRLRIEDDAPVEFVAFPPVSPQGVVERTEYLSASPQLIGAVRVLNGDRSTHEELLTRRASGEDWTSLLGPSDLMLTASACQPVYGMLTHYRVHHPRRFDLVGHCFRNESFDDPTRLMAFRMHEQVIVGSPVQAVDHRDQWRQKFLDLAQRLDLEVSVSVADDAPYGSSGRPFSIAEREEFTRYELLAPIAGDELSAIASLNAHLDHFGRNFSIALPDGSPAHTSCAALGLERTTLALLARHGVNIDRWPSDISSALGL